MNSKRLAGIGILISALVLGCSGTNVKLKTQSESESKVTQQELIDNWSAYNIWIYYKPTPEPKIAIIVFDAKNDNREMSVEDYMGAVKVKDQEMWTEVVKENTTSRGDFLLEPYTYARDTGIIATQEIRSSDNQLYGYVIHNERWPLYAHLVEENTWRIDVGFGNWGGAP